MTATKINWTLSEDTVRNIKEAWEQEGGWVNPWHLQIFADTSDHTVWTIWHYGNEYTKYHSDTIYPCTIKDFCVAPWEDITESLIKREITNIVEFQNYA